MPTDESTVRRDQLQVERRRGRGKKPVGRVRVRRRDASQCFRDRKCERRLLHWRNLEGPINPRLHFTCDLDPALFNKQRELPQRDRRQPKLTLSRPQRTRHTWRQSLGFDQTPDPDVRIQQQPH